MLPDPPPSATEGERSTPPTDDPGLDRVTASLVRPVTGGLSVLYLAVGTSEVLIEGLSPLSRDAGTSFLAGSLFALAYLVLRRRQIPDRWAQPAVAAVIAVTLGMTIQAFEFQRDPLLTVNLMLIALGSGLLYLAKPWLYGTLAVVVATFAGFVAVQPQAGSWGPLGSGLLGAVVLSVVVHNYRQGLLERLFQRRRIERQQRERIERYAAALEDSNAVLDSFASIVSHDLKEPLRVIESYLDLLEERYLDELDEDAREFIGYARDGSERMAERIAGLRAYSKVQTEGSELEPTPVGEVLDAVERDLAVRIEETDATIERGEMPTVLADRSQLEQVFQNLISNALKFAGDDGPPRIEVRGRWKGDRWLFTVEDDGPGIPEGAEDRLFDAFERLGQQDVDGTGIGLAICKRIVERHGGEIGVDSEPGEGARFWFTIPDADRDASPAGTPQAADGPARPSADPSKGSTTPSPRTGETHGRDDRGPPVYPGA